ncbi:MAG TPA: response regulator [Bryobacteraceae bacterium]|nr:response regulator [Bryobacteraceae bacterium]
MYAWEILAALGSPSADAAPAPSAQPPHSGVERRKEARYVVSEPATITVSQPAEFLPLQGHLSDVSRSGLRIRSPRPIHRGASLHVQLKHMVVFGHACYCRPAAQDEFDIGLAIDQTVIAPNAKDHAREAEDKDDCPLETTHAAAANIEVLLVEDNPGDVRLTELMLEATGIPHRLTVVTDGQQALERLFNSAMPKPGLMLLDLNLPRISGLKILECLRQDRSFDSIIVAILSSSSAEKEMRRSHELGAMAYLEKPMDCSHMMDVSTQVGALMSHLIQ